MNEEQTEQPVVGDGRPFADRISEMSRQELECRALTQRDYIERYQKCIDGLGLRGLDGHRFPGDITKAVRDAVGIEEEDRVRLQRAGYAPDRRAEQLFCLALLKALDIRQTQAVLDAYLDLRGRADEVLADFKANSDGSSATRETKL